MPYLEHAGDNCFVELQHLSETIRFRWGRIGEAGRTRTMPLKDSARAEHYYAKRLISLRYRGYKPGHHNHSFIRDIEESPDDDGIRQVYGDWLLDRGDPRGTLIAIHAALQKRPSDVDLLKRERRLLWDEHDTLLGRWGRKTQIDWHLGFAKSMVYTEDPEHLTDGSRIRGYIRDLLEHPTSRFIDHVLVRPALPLGPGQNRMIWIGMREQLDRDLARGSIDTRRPKPRLTISFAS